MQDDKGTHGLQTVEQVEAALTDLRAKRGYLLPHHGLLAVAAPELLVAYDATYSALTLAEDAIDINEPVRVRQKFFVNQIDDLVLLLPHELPYEDFKAT